MTNIRKFLDLSTAHLDADDKAYLDTCADSDSFGLPAGRMPYGWFMWAGSEMNTLDHVEEGGLTAHLATICEHAKSCDCDYVLFDADAEIDDALPVYETEGGMTP